MSLQLEMNNHDLSHYTRNPCCYTFSIRRSRRPLNNPRLWGTCGEGELPSEPVWVGRPETTALWRVQSSVSDFPLTLKPDAGSLCLVADCHKRFIFIAWTRVSEPHQFQTFVLPWQVWHEMRTISLPQKSSQTVWRWNSVFTVRTERGKSRL